MRFDIYNPAFMQEASEMSRCFRIQSVEDDNTISVSGYLLGDFADNIEYSVDVQKTWNQLNPDDEFVLNTGKCLYLRNKNGVDLTYQSHQMFNSSRGVNLLGDLIPIFYPSGVLVSKAFKELFMTIPVVNAKNLFLNAETLTDYCFEGMFYQCTRLKNAPELMATTLSKGCYASMFHGCISLIDAPKLQATITESSCYQSMFEGCISLEKTPYLPATYIANSCYYRMFTNCTSLIYASDLPGITVGYNSYCSMFEGCTSLEKAPYIYAKTIGQDACNSMFKLCTSLLYIQEALHITTLGYTRSCSSMFSDCILLAVAPELPATELKSNCYSYMFANTAIEKAPELPAKEVPFEAYYGMFSYCKKLKESPILPAQTLSRNCYGQMFYSCKNLSKVTCLAKEGANFYRWIGNCAEVGVFFKDPEATGWDFGSDGIPTGWTIEDYVEQ